MDEFKRARRERSLSESSSSSSEARHRVSSTASPLLNVPRPQVVILPDDDDDKLGNEEAPVTKEVSKKKRRTMGLYVMYGQVTPTTDKNFKYRCGFCSREGHNATFAKSHLAEHFGDEGRGTKLIKDVKKAFPKDNPLIQQSIAKFCKSEKCRAGEARHVWLF